MAEAWARTLAPPHVVARSAGTRPRHVHPLALRAMQEAGIDMSAQRGKSVEPMKSERFDLVVVLCETAASELPPLAAARTVHRAFDDPALLESADGPGDDSGDLDDYRMLRDALRAFVAELLSEA
ncbi:MAG: Glutaredoxin arsenate reductase [Planctomycetes bacterium]|nr:Glutaredoxin arsenate reductase [Planctomycetota bacterium]